MSKKYIRCFGDLHNMYLNGRLLFQSIDLSKSKKKVSIYLNGIFKGNNTEVVFVQKDAKGLFYAGINRTLQEAFNFVEDKFRFDMKNHEFNGKFFKDLPLEIREAFFEQEFFVYAISQSTKF
jgi:hypothetical protein